MSNARSELDNGVALWLRSMSTTPVTFVSLAAELQQRFALATAELEKIDALQAGKVSGAGPLAPMPLVNRLLNFQQVLQPLDFKPGPKFIQGFGACVREWDVVNRVAEHMAPIMEQGATPLRRFALDLALYTGAIGNIGKDVEPLLQMLGQLLSERDKMLKHKQAQDHVRTLFGQASEYAKRARLLTDLATAGGTLRATVTSLLDAQKALVAIIIKPLPDTWAHWHQFGEHYIETIRERPASARHHPALPELNAKLLSLVDQAIRHAEEAEKLKEKAREQLITVQKQVEACKGWK